ncbi:siphovirus Gp157 family protein [Parvibaculum sp.]|uniref:siphovirus Gp157 family protein n=1 Tax=Parvibaculum sp. TaxID=2024848 RepID=UPI001B1FCB76|nr:siphovirus Gp157 family protein [Parvibaculum sp.]MBO6668030.1 siphovirus Gp157 family protein [Parvibaculum sp.]MBO6690132.1 siphovirus Gp157 family protein [Henriciella sp.]MBO6715654.1 siphovirus Gp157 family protein [Parvibaculum sp.]
MNIEFSSQPSAETTTPSVPDEESRDRAASLPPALAAEFHAHNFLKERLTADFPDLDDETLADTLEGETGLNEALAAIVRSREEDLGLITGLKSRLEALKARLERFQDRADRKRRLVTDVMARAEIKRITEPDFTVSLRTSPAAVVVEDEALIPEDYWKPQAPKLDRLALGEALKSGQTIQGASLGEPKPSITIRIA